MPKFFLKKDPVKILNMKKYNFNFVKVLLVNIINCLEVFKTCLKEIQLRNLNFFKNIQLGKVVTTMLSLFF